jgi:hypothetical protein
MPTAIRVKRRLTGLPGAPASLKSGEFAWNMADGFVYGGKGDNGSGDATSVVALFKDDFVANIPAGGAALQALRKNGANNGYEWFTPSGTAYTGSSGITIVGNDIQVDFTLVAPKANAALTGTPTAPTVSTADSSTKIATTEYVNNRIRQIIGVATSAYDTFAEIQALMEADDTAYSALVTTVGGKLQKDQNLADLTNAATARTNLGLASMALQAASAVAITGGTMTGVDFDGGTF